MSGGRRLVSRSTAAETVHRARGWLLAIVGTAFVVFGLPYVMAALSLALNGTETLILVVMLWAGGWAVGRRRGPKSTDQCSAKFGWPCGDPGTGSHCFLRGPVRRESRHCRIALRAGRFAIPTDWKLAPETVRPERFMCISTKPCPSLYVSWETGKELSDNDVTEVIRCEIAG